MNPVTAALRWMHAQPYLRRFRAQGSPVRLTLFFDEPYYRRTYRGGLSPLTHFIVAGAFEGANPHPLFDTGFYLRKYPEVAASGVNPLFHYLLHGFAEGRKPHPMFQPDYYVAQCPDAAPNPLLHFLTAWDGRANPHPLFDCAGYLQAYPEARGVNPLVDWVLRGLGRAARSVTEGSAFGQGAA